MRSRRGPRRLELSKLHADKAYDIAELRRWVRDRGLPPETKRPVAFDYRAPPNSVRAQIDAAAVRDLMFVVVSMSSTKLMRSVWPDYPRASPAPNRSGARLVRNGRHAVSKTTYSYLAHYSWWAVMRWLEKRHPRLG